MTLASVFDGGALIATDTRWNLYPLDGGAPDRQDLGGKLVRFGSGWLTGTGDGILLKEVFSRIAKDDPEDLVGVREIAARSYLDRHQEIRDQYPDTQLEKTLFLQVSDQPGTGFKGLRELVAFQAHGGEAGTIVREQMTDAISWPPELVDGDPRKQEVADEWADTCRDAPDALTAVRATAHLFHRVSSMAPSMSGEIHFALVHDAGMNQDLVLRADVLAQMSNEEILRALRT